MEAPNAAWSYLKKLSRITLLSIPVLRTPVMWMGKGSNLRRATSMGVGLLQTSKGLSKVGREQQGGEADSDSPALRRLEDPEYSIRG